MKTMKTIRILMAATMLLIGVSCTEDTPNFEESIAGSTWVHKANDQVGTLEFQEKTFSLFYTYEHNGQECTSGGTGEYSYECPVVTLIVYGEEIMATIQGDKMVADGATFIRQRD